MNGKQIIRILQTIHIALTIGIIMSNLIIYLALKPENTIFELQNALLFSGALCILNLFAYLMQRKINQNKIEKLCLEKNLKQKMQKYISYSIINMAFIELFSFVPLVFYFLFGHPLLLTASLFSVFLLILIRPTLHKCINELHLDFNEQNQMMDDTFAITDAKQFQKN